MSWVPLANTTLSNSSSATVTFSSITQSYRDLFAVYNGETLNSGNNDIGIYLNGDTTNHSSQQAYGTGSAQGAYTQNYAFINLGSGARSLVVCNLLDYSSTDKHKLGLVRLNSTNLTAMSGLRYASTNAVTSVTFVVTGGTFASGSTFALYGVSA